MYLFFENNLFNSLAILLKLVCGIKIIIIFRLTGNDRKIGFHKEHSVYCHAEGLTK